MEISFAEIEAEMEKNMKQYECYELKFSGPEPENHAGAEVLGSFEINGKTTEVKGFYAGENTYVVRYLPMEPGMCRYRVSGAVSGSGEVQCEPAEGKQCGIVRAEGTHFQYEGGAYFHPFGTTVYALTHQDDALAEETFASLARAPFNKIRFCVFPKHYDFNHNEPPLYAFEKKGEGWDVSRPCFAFWNRLESYIRRLGGLGIECDLILFHPYDRWGFAAMPRQDNLLYLDYLLRRLAAFPNVWWSLANEYDLCAAKSLEEWEEIEAFVAENDPYGHLLSNHNCFKHWDFARPHVTHVSIQSKALYNVAEWRRRYGKPVVIDECCYEGNIRHFWGSISGREMVNRFWRAVTMGGYCTHGETFLDPEREVLWWSRGGTLKGKSPERIAFLREIVEALPSPMEPMDTPLTKLLHVSDEAEIPKEAAPFARAALRLGDELREFCACEFTYQGHCGEEVYLYFYDGRTCIEDILELPEGRGYRVELIDTWEMSRTTLSECASGRTQIALPGREGMAVLAAAISG